MKSQSGALRVLIIAAASMVITPCLLQHAFAQGAYPTKPIRLIVAYAPGGATDIVARVVAPPMSEVLGKTVVVENRGGAGGTIGMDAVAKAAPDGYTLSFGGTGNLVLAPYLYSKIPYNVQTDLAPISDLVISAYVLALNPTVPARTIADFIKLAKTSKSRLTYGTSGGGSTSHIAAELLRRAIGVEMVHVPYKGTGPALGAVVAGEIDIMVADLTPSLPLAKNGRLRLLATTGAKRSSAAPELPTMAEAGLKMPVVEGRQGLVAPTGTPAAIIARLHSAAATVLKRNDVRSRIAELGFEILGDTPEQFAADLKSDREVFSKVIRQAAIHVD
jgi:tripartite-type tricarboxylate transporter receptor subunit TctC